MRPAIFLDRDGVIIENRSSYVRRWEDVDFYPSAVQALARYASSHYAIAIITNQSAVGRGIISSAQAEMINQKFAIELEKNSCRVDGIFMCPHSPDENCSCRKPSGSNEGHRCFCYVFVCSEKTSSEAFKNLQ